MSGFFRNGHHLGARTTGNRKDETLASLEFLHVPSRDRRTVEQAVCFSYLVLGTASMTSACTGKDRVGDDVVARRVQALDDVECDIAQRVRFFGGTRCWVGCASRFTKPR